VLLRAGANINSVDNDGWTPLHAAAHWDKHDVIQFLLDRSADLDAKNYAVNVVVSLVSIDGSMAIRVLRFDLTGSNAVGRL
jgi:ankyrin repeat protein